MTSVSPKYITLSRLRTRIVRIAEEAELIESELGKWAYIHPELSRAVGLMDSAAYALQSAKNEYEDFLTEQSTQEVGAPN